MCVTSLGNFRCQIEKLRSRKVSLPWFEPVPLPQVSSSLMSPPLTPAQVSTTRKGAGAGREVGAGRSFFLFPYAYYIIAMYMCPILGKTKGKQSKGKSRTQLRLKPKFKLEKLKDANCSSGHGFCFGFAFWARGKTRWYGYYAFFGSFSLCLYIYIHI